MTKFRPALAPEYAFWLMLRIQQGGKITHYYDYPMNRAGILVALKPFTLAGECGSAAHNILVTEAAPYQGGPLGHCNLFFPDGTVKGGIVPAYSDAVFHGLPGFDEGMAESRRQSAEFAAQAMQRSARDPYSDLTRYSAGDRGDVVLTAPPSGSNVFVEDGRVCLIPSSMPLRMTPNEALALAENLRAAALGASR